MNWIGEMIGSQGYLGVFLAMVIENFLQFIPSEAIMPLAGYLVSEGQLSFWPTSLAGTLGTVVGTFPWYLIGRMVNEERLEELLQKHGAWFGLTPGKLHKSRRWFLQHGRAIVFWGRLVPILRTVVSIPAGIEMMPLRSFLIWTSLGSLIWNVFLTATGYLLGKNWTLVHHYLQPISILVAVILVVAAVIFVIRKQNHGQEP